MVVLVAVARLLVHNQTQLRPFNHVPVGNSRSRNLFFGGGGFSESHPASTVFAQKFIFRKNNCLICRSSSGIRRSFFVLLTTCLQLHAVSRLRGLAAERR